MNRISIRLQYPFVIALLCVAHLQQGCAHRSGQIVAANAVPQSTPAEERFGAWSLQFSGNLERWFKSERVRLQVMMLAHFSNQMRVDLMTPLGSSAVLTVDGTAVALYDRQNGTLKSGAVCSSTVESLIGISLSPSEMLRMLVGMPSLLSGNEERNVHRRTLKVRRSQPEGATQTLWYHQQKSGCGTEPALLLDAVELQDAAGARVWKAQYVDYRVLRADSMCAELPRQIRFVGRDRHEVRIDIKSIRARADVDPALFSQSPGPGTVVETIACGD